MSDREVGSDTRALFVPVLARGGAPLAAVGIVVRPTTTTLDEFVELYAARMLSIAERITVAPRYRG